MKPSFTLTPLLLALLLTACATQPTPAQKAAVAEAQARQIIIDKVDAAVLAQRELAVATQEGKQMMLRKQAALGVDEVDIDYIGKPQPLLESLAHRYGYKYIETGKRLELKTINMRVVKRPVIEVLRDIGHQIDSGADVVLDKDAKIVRVVYKKG